MLFFPHECKILREWINSNRFQWRQSYQKLNFNTSPCFSTNKLSKQKYCKQTGTLSTLFVYRVWQIRRPIFICYTVQLPKRATQKLHLRNMKLFLIDDRNSSCLTSINYLLDLIMKYLWQYMGSMGNLSAISVWVGASYESYC